MSITKQPENAEPRADLAVSQLEPEHAASLVKDENSQESRTAEQSDSSTASQPEEQPIPRTAIGRNIRAVEILLARYPERIAKARQRREFGDAASLEKERQNLLGRKAALERLRDQEARKGL